MADTPYPYELATAEQRAIGSFWWCLHHQVKMEPLTSPIEERVEYIRTKKPERVHEMWLRAMRPVVGPVAPAMIEAYAQWQRANKATIEAAAAYHASYADCASEVNALFAIECADVPWGPGGFIFPPDNTNDLAIAALGRIDAARHEISDARSRASEAEAITNQALAQLYAYFSMQRPA